MTEKLAEIILVWIRDDVNHAIQGGRIDRLQSMSNAQGVHQSAC